MNLTSPFSLERFEQAVSMPRLPPINEWTPALTRDLDIRITANGEWWYQGSKIDRERMVRLFSTVLQVDENGNTYLVSPQERLRITVDDAPFIAVLVERHGEPEAPTLVFATNVGDTVVASESNPIRVDYAEPEAEPAPYVLVRDRLWARIARAPFYQLAEWAETRDGVIGVESSGQFMPLVQPGACDNTCDNN